jgi:hypothetical protein
VRFFSPSSRLVLLAVVVAVLALTLTGKAQVGTAGPTPTEPQVAAATRLGPPDTEPPATLAPATLAPATLWPTSGPETAAPTWTAIPPPPTRTPKPTSQSTPKPVACQPTDQDKYVYNPDRLEVGAACIYVTGTIDAVRKEADGDLHLLLHLDPAYAHFLTPANQGEELGDLVVEPVCVKSVTQPDAEASCAADPDPLAPPFPGVGERVWMEGRYVFDLDHSGWAELHPLFRWGDL